MFIPCHSQLSEFASAALSGSFEVQLHIRSHDLNDQSSPVQSPTQRITNDTVTYDNKWCTQSHYNVSNYTHLQYIYIYYHLWRPGNLLLDALAISHQRLVEESMLWAASERGSLDLHTSNSLAASIASILCTGLSSLCALVPFTCHILSLTCPCCQGTAGRLHWECHTFCLVRIARRTEPFELPSGRFWFISYAMQKTTPLDSGLAQVQGYSALPQDVVQPSGSQWIFSHRKAWRHWRLCLALWCICVHLASCWRITWALRTLGLRFVSTHPVRLCMDPGKCKECVLTILWSISQFDKASNSICMVSQGEEGLRGYVER